MKVARLYSKKIAHLQVIVSSKANLPFQRNLGASKAQGDWLVFADADGKISSIFFDSAKAFIDTEKAVGFFPWFMPDSLVSGGCTFYLAFKHSY